jgi:hypothetical protein
VESLAEIARKAAPTTTTKESAVASSGKLSYEQKKEQ